MTPASPSSVPKASMLPPAFQASAVTGAQFRRLAHGAILALERPQDQLVRSGGRERSAVGGEGKRAHPLAIAGHPQVLAVGKPPAVQHRLLHGGDEKAAVGTEQHAEMRALPGKLLRFGLRIGKPKRDAIVIGDRQTQPLARKRKAADRRRRLKHALVSPGGAHENLLAR